jgi:hypothetical protein
MSSRNSSPPPHRVLRPFGEGETEEERGVKDDEVRHEGLAASAVKLSDYNRRWSCAASVAPHSARETTRAAQLRDACAPGRFPSVFQILVLVDREADNYRPKPLFRQPLTAIEGSIQWYACLISVRIQQLRSRFRFTLTSKTCPAGKAGHKGLAVVIG